MSPSAQAKLGCSAVVGFFVFIICFWWTWTTIPAGHVGVLTTFGSVNSKPIHSGFNFVLPWKAVHKMSVRTQTEPADDDVPTKDNTNVKLEATLLYSLAPERAPSIFEKYGPDYKDVLITKQFHSVLRDTTVGYRAEDLYTANRANIEHELLKKLKETFKDDGVQIDGVLLSKVSLPPSVQKAVERKLAMDQENQQMQYRILKEEKEAERKRVEAHGIADAQKIIQNTLTDSYLTYKWIEALERAAEHNNTIIYIPTGERGIPLFKDVDKVQLPKKQ